MYSLRSFTFSLLGILLGMNTMAQTVTAVTDLNTGAGNSGPGNLYLDPTQQYLYFTAYNDQPNTNQEWYKLKLSDNSITAVSSDFLNYAGGVIIRATFKVGNNVFFAGAKSLYNGSQDLEFNRLDLSTGAMQFADLDNTISSDSYGGFVADENNDVYFMGFTAVGGAQIYKWKNSDKTIAKITNFGAAMPTSQNGGIAYSNGYLYFQINRATYDCGGGLKCIDDTELARYKVSDGTLTTYDIFPGTFVSGTFTLHYGSSPTNIKLYNNKILFTGNCCAGTGAPTQLFTMDPSVANDNPQKLTSFTGTTSSSDINGFLYDGNNKVYFVADDVDTQRELYVVDVSTNTVTKLTNFATNATFIQPMAIYNGFLYFSQRTSTSGANASIKKLNLSTNAVTDISTTPQLVATYSIGATAFTVSGSKIFFQGNSSAHGTELWQVDMATDAATRLSDIQAGTTNSVPLQFTALPNGGVAFRATGSTGTELYRYAPAAQSPIISSTGTPTALATTYGTASNTTSISVSATNLTAGVLVSSPANFEVSLSASTGFANTITVGSTGTLSATTVYIRLKSTAAVGSYSGDIVLSSTGATSINISIPNSTVSKKELTVTGATAQNKTYDGTASATITGGTLVGVVGSEVVTISGGGTFANPNIGTAKAVTASLVLGGTNAGNYTLAQPTGLAANILAKELTVTGVTAQNKTYDGTATATITGGTLVGVVGSDVVTISGGGTFANPNIGTAKAVTASLVLGGTNAGNYTLVQPTGLTANIIPIITTWNGSAWTNGIPTSNSNVVLDNSYSTILYGNITANELKINNLDTLFVQSNGVIQASAIVNNGAIITCSGTITGTISGNNIQTIGLPVIDIHPGDVTVQELKSATFSVTASGQYIHYQWKRGAVNVGVNSHLLTVPNVTKANDNGSTYNVTVANACGKVTSNLATLTVTLVTGLNDASWSNLEVYPNPTTGKLLFSASESVKSVAVFNSLGIMVLESKSPQFLDLQDLSSGLYFVEVVTAEGKRVFNITKQ